MSTLTKEWLLKTIAELEEERDAVPGVVNEDAAMALAAMKRALASLEAEAGVYQTHVIDDGCGEFSERMNFSLPVGTKLYTAPPALVSVPDELTREECKRRFMEEDNFDDTFRGGWSACRAAMLQGAEPDFREISNSSTKHFRENAETSTKCWCRTCRPVTFADSHFVVCPECGNKRCPHANDHRHACTGSNEPGQEGSAYPAAPQQEVK
ncbi:hypothetical protein ABKV75_11920 [Enterobacter hormaechei]